MLKLSSFVTSVVVGMLAECWVVAGLDNGLALTPPMGFNTWERYRCEVDCKNFPDGCIGETLMMKIANEMKRGGYLNAGYEYLVVDDCWMSRRRNDAGYLVEDPERFPRGMQFLVDYVHKLGLKFGIYENHGKSTCMGYPGTHGKYIEKDAELFSKWKVDYVKMDGCFTPLRENDEGYPKFGKYLKKFGRPIVYSCSWPYYMVNKGFSPNYTAVMEHCNLWRNFHDVQDDWDAVRGIVNFYGDNQDTLSRFHGPDHWHDADMLIIGNYALSYEQSKTQMALWCVMGVPLFISTDITRIRPELKEILLNRIAIGIDQDPMGKMGRRIYNKDGVQMWRKAIRPEVNSYCSYAVVIVNFRTDGNPMLISSTAKDLGLYNPTGYKLVDVFNPKDRKNFMLHHVVSVKIPPSGSAFWKFTVIGASNDVDYDEWDATAGSKCRDADPIVLPNRDPYSVDIVTGVYFTVALVMLFILMKTRIGPARRLIPTRSINTI